jgi:hypothetical protein
MSNTLMRNVASHPALEIDLKQTAIVTCIAMPPARLNLDMSTCQSIYISENRQALTVCEGVGSTERERESR